jgi:hypothetical protein
MRMEWRVAWCPGRPPPPPPPLLRRRLPTVSAPAWPARTPAEQHAPVSVSFRWVISRGRRSTAARLDSHVWGSTLAGATQGSNTRAEPLLRNGSCWGAHLVRVALRGRGRVEQVPPQLQHERERVHVALAPACNNTTQHEISVGSQQGFRSSFKGPLRYQ